MIKPPSPRQIHPVLDKGDMKCSHHHHTHYPTTHHPLFSQYPILRKKSSTLPSSEESSACPFIRVNSGRIELVSAKENPGSWKSGDSSKGITSNEPYTNVLITNNTLTSFHPDGSRSRGGGSGRNDARHSWCGSAIREDLVVSKKMSGAEDVEQVSPGVVIPTHSNNTTKPPVPYVRQKSQLSPPSPAKAPRKLASEDKAYSHRPPPPPPPPPPSSSSSSSSSSVHNKLEAVAAEDGTERVVVLSPGFSPTMTVGASAGNVRVLLSPLKERLTAIEKLTANLASWQDAEKSDYEKCVEDLATQVSRAVALQTLMKSEFEKLQERVEELENHNKTMATMIIPTLMKLHDPEEGEKIDESTSQSMVSEAESRLDEGSSEDGKIAGDIAKTDCRIPRTSTTKLSRTNPTTSSTLTSSTRVNTKNARSGGVMSKSDNHQPHTSPHTTTRLLSSSSKSESTLTSSPSLRPSACSARNLGRTELPNNNQSSRSRSSSSSRTSNYTKIPKTSGIPRMSSPRPPPHSSSSPVLQSPARVRKTDGGRQAQDTSSAPASTSVGGSRLPVRRAIASAISRIPATSQPSSHKSVHSGKHNNSKFSKVNGVPIPAGISRASSSTGSRNNPSETEPTIQLKSKTGTKDEGYSTMSSEALAEQEKSTLERSTLDRIELPGSCSRSGGVELLRVHSTTGGASSKTMHKSNTFNTFREIRLPGGYRTEDRVTKNGKLITPDARNFTSLPVPATRASILMNRRELSSNLVPAVATSSNNSSFTDSPRHLPKKSPLFPRKSLSGSPPTLLTSTPLSASTRPPAFNNVRIIRGIPYELSEGELDAHPSSSTILWEDSDDSDVLFLPLEISSESSSRSTLIPLALESNPLLPASKIPSKLPAPTTHHHHNPLVIPSKPGKGERDKRKSSNPSATSALPTAFSLPVSEDSALIEKWMRLEDVRNEVQWDDEWAWDWDGVQPPPVKSLRSIRETEDDNDREGDDEEEEDEDFWKLPSLGKERIQHLTDLFQPLPDLNSFVHTLDFQESSKGTLNPSSSPSSNTKSSASAQIDSSTWTKSKCGKIKAKLAQFHATEEDDQNPDSFPAPISKSLEKRHKKKKTKSPSHPIDSTDTQLSPHPSPAHTSRNAGTQFNPDVPDDDDEEEQLLINHQLQFHPDHENESSNDPSLFLDSSNPNDDGPPPVIEFTPEFYHLVNYGSNLSFSDNESNSNSPHHHHHHHQPGAKPPASSTRLNSPSTSINYNHSPFPANNVNNFHKKLTKSSKMDDKVSQTDFVSSFENMSISSELFTECRNCLEIIKKLVAEDCVVGEKSADPSSQPITTLDRQISIQAAEKKTDAGSPTTWVSIPHGLPSTEVDRILEILSSSESEDILSPSK